jgi:Spy/CpxP family protein refolding chaperone
MRRMIHALVGIGLLVAGSATQIQAQPFRGIQERLELSQEQIAQMQELHEKQADETRAAQAEMIKARAEIQALMVDPDRDLRALERALKVQADLQVAGQIRALTHRQALMNVLTEEQQAGLRDRAGQQVAGRGARRADAGRSRVGSRFHRSGRAGSRFGRAGRSGSRFGRSRSGVRSRFQGRSRTRQPVGRSFGRRAIPPGPIAEHPMMQRRERIRVQEPPPPPPA